MVPSEVRRFGVYGILIKDCQILLTRKQRGPFQGLWDLPGGGIEFGEAPLQALKREILEETALQADDFVLVDVLSTFGEYTSYTYHFLSIIYRVKRFVAVSDGVPEEEGRWSDLSILSSDEVTPNIRQLCRSSIELF